MDRIGVDTSCFFMETTKSGPGMVQRSFRLHGNHFALCDSFQDSPRCLRKGWRLVENPERVLAVGVFLVNCFTLPETNIAPENGWLEYYFPIGKAYFQVLC